MLTLPPPWLPDVAIIISSYLILRIIFVFAVSVCNIFAPALLLQLLLLLPLLECFSPVGISNHMTLFTMPLLLLAMTLAALLPTLLVWDNHYCYAILLPSPILLACFSVVVWSCSCHFSQLILLLSSWSSLLSITVLSSLSSALNFLFYKCATGLLNVIHKIQRLWI